ncbi:MAG TPA: ferredoxin--NADP reductase [Polyangiaceae bacterium]|nr:ferredoxin--NADP reductase [Polyangiaceae bacterium]
MEGIVRARRDWANGLMSLTVEAALPTFSPGQFVNISLSRGGNTVRRAYSFASAPGELAEFYVSEVPGGALTPTLFGLQVGDSLSIDGRPQGFFTLEWVPPAEVLWMLATGTGLAPFLSMLRSGQAQARFRRIVLVHSARHVQELSYAEQLAQLAQNSSCHITVLRTVTREACEVPILSGRITSLFNSGELEARAGTALLPTGHVMLCGNPGMIDEMTALLATRGLRRHRVRSPGHITSERYWD